MKKVEDLLQQFLDRIGQSEGAVYVGLFRTWRQIVGDRIADHTEPVDVRGSALIVEADHPGWIQMVMLSRAKILRELKRRYPELGITGLHIRVSGERGGHVEQTGRERAGGPAADRSDAPAEERKEPSPSENEKEALTRIDDEELRDTLESLRRTLDDDE